MLLALTVHVVAPPADVDPDGQLVQLVAPALAEYVPAAHGALTPFEFTNVPGGVCVHTPLEFNVYPVLHVTVFVLGL